MKTAEQGARLVMLLINERFAASSEAERQAALEKAKVVPQTLLFTEVDEHGVEWTYCERADGSYWRSRLATEADVAGAGEPK